MYRFLLIVAFVMTGLAHAAEPAPAPSTDHRVLIISVDGLRPDLLLRSKTPVLQKLMDQGSYTCWAQTTAVSVTLPSHVSMLTGVKPQIHQIEWNHDIPLSSPVYPKVPTLFELAKHAGYSTGRRRKIRSAKILFAVGQPETRLRCEALRAAAPFCAAPSRLWRARCVCDRALPNSLAIE